MTARHSTSVRIEAPARLHLGFLDLHGGLGRRFGSLGLTIDAFATRLHTERAPSLSAEGPDAARALACARAYMDARGFAGGARLRIAEAIPGHAGLGSGTQLALAVGAALEQLYGTASADARSIAATLGRGGRSGIGIGAFEAGGFILDGGRGEPSAPPPVLMRLPVPAEWRVLLLLDPRGEGLHGDQEIRAFAELPEFPEAAAGRLCRLLLMQLAPGLIEGQFDPVADAIGQIQRAVGAHFAQAQGGCFTSPAVAAALDWAAAQGFAGSGQSSWGPTGFVLTENADRARWLEQGLKRRFGELSPLRYRIAAARNSGARVEPVQTPLQSIQAPLPSVHTQ